VIFLFSPAVEFRIIPEHSYSKIENYGLCSHNINKFKKNTNTVVTRKFPVSEIEKQVRDQKGIRKETKLINIPKKQSEAE
jgi:hypothetical protein